jgi:class 3 adenylate cyclase
MLAQENFNSAHFPTVVLQNTSPEMKTFILEENKTDQDTLRPVDLFSFQGFRDLFSQEALAADLKLEIGVQTILFTDLVGSTKFYEQEGDTVAFAEVRQHFLRTYEAVKNHNGAVVKTIGDAVMAAFVSPLDAMRAAVDLQRYFNGDNPGTRLRLRVTLNSGSCLAVNLNSNIDYFGNTVNLAAKIQSIADAGQVGFTQSVLNDTEIVPFLKEQGLLLEKLDYETKWAKKIIPVYRVDVK